MRVRADVRGTLRRSCRRSAPALGRRLPALRLRAVAQLGPGFWDTLPFAVAHAEPSFDWSSPLTDSLLGGLWGPTGSREIAQCNVIAHRIRSSGCASAMWPRRNNSDQAALVVARPWPRDLRAEHSRHRQQQPSQGESTNSRAWKAHSRGRVAWWPGRRPFLTALCARGTDRPWGNGRRVRGSRPSAWARCRHQGLRTSVRSRPTLRRAVPPRGPCGRPPQLPVHRRRLRQNFARCR
jgi:hypothetical protein